MLARLGVKCRDPEQPVGELSGGNQQKVALGRLFHQEADVLLLDEPTQGRGCRQQGRDLPSDRSGSRGGEGRARRQQLPARAVRRLRHSGGHVPRQAHGPATRGGVDPRSRDRRRDRSDNAARILPKRRYTVERWSKSNASLTVGLDSDVYTVAPAQRPFAVPAGPWVGFVAVLVLFTLLIGIKGELGTFLSRRQSRVLLHEGTIPAIVGLGMLLVLITGGIDLSVGAVVALVTVVTMRVYTGLYYSWGPGPRHEPRRGQRPVCSSVGCAG